MGFGGESLKKEELCEIKKGAQMTGFEPATPGLEVLCAIHCATPADLTTIHSSHHL